MQKVNSQSDPRVSLDTERCAVACSLPDGPKYILFPKAEKPDRLRFLDHMAMP